MSVEGATSARLVVSNAAIVRMLSWPVGALCVIVHLTWRDPGFSEQAALCAGLLGALAVIALAHTRPHTLPAVPFFLVHFYLAFGAAVFSPPVLYGNRGRIWVSSYGFDEALLAALLFPLIAAFGWLPMVRVGKKYGPGLGRILDREGKHREGDVIAARSVAVASVVLRFVLQTGVLGATPLGGWQHIATLFVDPTLPLAVLYWDAERTRTPVARAFFWAALSLIVLAGLGTGALGLAVQPMLVTWMLMWTVRGRLPVGIIVAAVFTFTMLNSAKFAYRSLTWDRNYVGMFERAENWGTAVSRTYEGRGSEVISESAQGTAHRFTVLAQVAQILDWVPARVPYAGPQQWLQLPLEFVPRGLWANKPVHMIEFNNRYTVNFGLQHWRDTKRTAITLPVIGDGYWRLGWLGVVIEALLFGALVGFHQGIAAAPTRGLVVIAIGFLASTPVDQHVFLHLSARPQFFLLTSMIMIMIQGLAAGIEAMRPRRSILGSPNRAAIGP